VVYSIVSTACSSTHQSSTILVASISMAKVFRG
jgi:hypothetical protein